MRHGTEQVQTPISPHQIKLIHVLKTALGMDDDQYRCALYEGFRVESSKELTFVQAEAVLRSFKEKALAKGVWKERAGKEKPRKLGGRPGYASPGQISYIEGLWKDVSRAEEKDRARALRSFLVRQVGVSDLRFLRSDQVTAVIFALKRMKARQTEDAE